MTLEQDLYIISAFLQHWILGKAKDDSLAKQWMFNEIYTLLQ